MNNLTVNKEACKKAIEKQYDEERIVCHYYNMLNEDNFFRPLREEHTEEQRKERLKLYSEALAYMRTIAKAKNIGWNAYAWKLKA